MGGRRGGGKVVHTAKTMRHLRRLPIRPIPNSIYSPYIRTRLAPLTHTVDKAFICESIWSPPVGHVTLCLCKRTKLFVVSVNCVLSDNGQLAQMPANHLNL